MPTLLQVSYRRCRPLSPADHKRLRSIVDDRSSLQKHVWRARIVLATADGVGIVEIMRAASVSKTAVWRRQARFRGEGAEGFFAILIGHRLERGISGATSIYWPPSPASSSTTTTSQSPSSGPPIPTRPSPPPHAGTTYLSQSANP
nr:helix-turn-helix domain-containing protein [Labrys sp. KNU-23]